MRGIAVAAGLLVLCIGHVQANEDTEQSEPWWSGGTGGVVFNYDGDALDLTSYQAGVGVKVQKDDVGNRLHGDLFFSEQNSTFEIGFGYTRERHLVSGIVEPYLGFTVRTQLVRRKTEYGEDNWTVNYSVPLAAGPVLGVELRPVEFLGIFAEYELIASIGTELIRTAAAGAVETETNVDIFVDTAMGNAGRVGVVVYFPLEFLSRDQAEE
jgi:hypothetical protein